MNQIKKYQIIQALSPVLLVPILMSACAQPGNKPERSPGETAEQKEQLSAASNYEKLSQAYGWESDATRFLYATYPQDSDWYWDEQPSFLKQFYAYVYNIDAEGSERIGVSQKIARSKTFSLLIKSRRLSKKRRALLTCCRVAVTSAWHKMLY